MTMLAGEGDGSGSERRRRRATSGDRVRQPAAPSIQHAAASVQHHAAGGSRAAALAGLLELRARGKAAPPLPPLQLLRVCL
jgi:hypothetical protein